MGLESLDWQKISMDEWEEAKKNVIHQVQQVGYISSYDWDGIKKEWKSRRRGWVQKKQKEEKQLQEFNRLHSLERRSKKPFVKFLSSIYKIVAPQKSKKIGVEYLTWKRDVAGKARDFYQYLYEGLEKGLEEQEVKREILKQSLEEVANSSMTNANSNTYKELLESMLITQVDILSILKDMLSAKKNLFLFDTYQKEADRVLFDKYNNLEIKLQEGESALRTRLRETNEVKYKNNKT